MSTLLTRIRRDHYAGALMFMMGGAATIESVHYRLGNLSHMGPGFFPAAVGALLALAGVAIFASAKRNPAAGSSQRPEWRSYILIALSLVAFVVLGIWGGLVPATFAIVFISALADRDNSWKDALVLSLAMELVCVVVFWWLLRVQFPLFRWG